MHVQRRKRMERIRKVVVALTIVMLSLSGCNNQTSMEETLPPESIKEEEDTLDLKPVDEVKDTTAETTPQKQEGDDITEKEEKPVFTYQGGVFLTEDSVAQVLKDFLSIADEEDLKKLEELPLTENFYNQCVEDFPYIENVEEYQEINIEFWSVDEEGKCVSLVSFCKAKNPMDNPILAKPEHVYCIEMDIVGDQIDTMKMEFMR